MNSATGRVEWPIVIITSGTDDLRRFIPNIRCSSHDSSKVWDAHSGFQLCGAKEQGDENHKWRETGNGGGM